MSVWMCSSLTPTTKNVYPWSCCWLKVCPQVLHSGCPLFCKRVKNLNVFSLYSSLFLSACQKELLTVTFSFICFLEFCSTQEYISKNTEYDVLSISCNIFLKCNNNVSLYCRDKSEGAKLYSQKNLPSGEHRLAPNHHQISRNQWTSLWRIWIQSSQLSRIFTQAKLFKRPGHNVSEWKCLFIYFVQCRPVVWQVRSCKTT